MPTKLTPHAFMNAQTSAGTYGLYPIDVAYDEDRLRSISGTRADLGDQIMVLLETVVPQFSADGTPATSIVVTATATVWTSANGTYNSCVLQGAYTRVKLQKVGAGGAATFVGYL